MGVFSKVKDFEKKKAQRKADAMSVVESPSPSVLPQAEVNKPALDKMTWKNTGIVPMAGQGVYRTEALRDMDENQFAQNQAKMNASEKEYWVEQAKANPTSTYANLKSYLASSETPEEKAKREKRERLGEVFNNLGNLIGNAANLYYTSKGGQYIDLNAANEKHQARMDAIKAKQDALKQRQDEMLMQYKVADIQAAREAAAKKEERVAAEKQKQSEREWKMKYDSYMKELDNAYKMGQIDAQTKAKIAEAAMKTQSSKELEDYRQKNRQSLAASNHQRIIEREEARGGGSRATVRVPRKDGKGYDEYRKNDLTNPIVVSQIYHSLPDTYKSSSKYEEPTLQSMQAAIGKALNDGEITEISSEIELSGNGEDKQAPHRKSKKTDNDNVPPTKRK